MNFFENTDGRLFKQSIWGQVTAVLYQALHCYFTQQSIIVPMREMFFEVHNGVHQEWHSLP